MLYTELALKNLFNLIIIVKQIQVITAAPSFHSAMGTPKHGLLTKWACCSSVSGNCMQMKPQTLPTTHLRIN